MSHKDVERAVLDVVRPDAAERARVSAAVGKVVAVAKKITTRSDRRIEVMLVGSVAKDTWLTGAKDIDVFLIFPAGDYDEEDLEEEGLPMIDRIACLLEAKTELKYAQHPYVTLKFSGYDFDLVPCLKGPEVISAVDRTPAHSEYVKKHIRNVDEARLLKQFCIGAGTYGADMKNMGFSGYLCELLVIRYGGFFGVLKAASGWKPPRVRLDLGNDRGRKFPEPFVFVDPVDPDRNVASAVAEGTLSRFVSAANSYLTAPKESAFFPKEVKPLAKLPANRNLVLLLFDGPEGAGEDVIYSQLRSLSDHLLRHGISEFLPGRHDVFYIDGGNALIAFEFVKRILPKLVVHAGPPLRSPPRFIEAFTKKYRALGKKVFEERGRLNVRLERRFRSPEELLKNELGSGIIPKHLGAKAGVLSGQRLLKFYGSASPEIKKFITRFLKEKVKAWSWK